MTKTIILFSSIGLLAALFLYQNGDLGLDSRQKESQQRQPQANELVQETVNLAQTNDAPVAQDIPASNTPQAGLKAYISPKGELITEEQARTNKDSKAIAQQPQDLQSKSELPPIELTTHDNGMVRIKMNGRNMIPQTVSVDCDGEVTKRHSEQLTTAESCLETQTPE